MLDYERIIIKWRLTEMGKSNLTDCQITSLFPFVSIVETKGGTFLYLTACRLWKILGGISKRVWCWVKIEGECVRLNWVFDWLSEAIEKSRGFVRWTKVLSVTSSMARWLRYAWWLDWMWQMWQMVGLTAETCQRIASIFNTLLSIARSFWACSNL